MTKVSFDFDSTLDRGDVQHLAKQLVKVCDVWIVTSRVSDDTAPSDTWNNDLWWVCDHVGISRDNVIFTCYSSKHEFFWTKDFLFHLDDDPDELHMIGAMTDTIPIDVESPDWKDKIKELIL